MYKILIVEDEPDTALVLTKRLQKQSYSVMVASDAYQAIEKAYKDTPDLVMLDLMLPAGGGLSVLKKLRASSRTMYTPVIVLTASKDEEQKKEVLAIGVEAYIEKPYDFHSILDAIKGILKPNP